VAPEVALVVPRLLLALLIAVGVTLAPVGAALAASAQVESAAAMADMPDCPSKAKKTSKDCGCCDAAAPCQSDLCLAKCFKLNGDVVKSVALHGGGEAFFIKAPPSRPPDNSPEPQAPPPRA
jgi:hypothetical protein